MFMIGNGIKTPFAERLLSGEPLKDGRPLSELIKLDEHTRKALAFEATLTDEHIAILRGMGYFADVPQSEAWNAYGE